MNQPPFRTGDLYDLYHTHGSSRLAQAILQRREKGGHGPRAGS